MPRFSVMLDSYSGGGMTAVMLSGEQQGAESPCTKEKVIRALPQGTDSCWSAAFSQLPGSNTGSEWYCCSAQPSARSSSCQVFGRDGYPMIASLREILKLCVRNVKDRIATVSGSFPGDSQTIHVRKQETAVSEDKQSRGIHPPFLYITSQLNWLVIIAILLVKWKAIDMSII